MDAQPIAEFVAAAVGAPAAAVRVAPLVGQASARAYWRAETPGRAYVVMVMPPSAKASEEAVKGAPPTELPFLNVQRYLRASGLRVPEIVAYDEHKGLMLLEDLGDVTLEAALRGASPERVEALYAAAVSQLARLRAAAERNPDAACVAFGRAFDFDLYRWELDHFLYWGLFSRAGVEPSAIEGAVLRAHFASVCRELGELPRGFTHRDYQSRNLMVLPDGAVAVIDFQDALLGPRQYDLVALLRDSYVVLPDSLVVNMIALYVKSFEAAGGERLDLARFRREFDVLTVQRKLKDGGRFEFIARVKKNPSFLPSVPASFGYVRDALRRLPEHAPLLEVLARHLPELR